MTLLKLSRLQGAKRIGAKKTMFQKFILVTFIFRSGIILFIKRFCAKRHRVNLPICLGLIQAKACIRALLVTGCEFEEEAI